jgi:hypothetical protein
MKLLLLCYLYLYNIYYKKQINFDEYLINLYIYIVKMLLLIYYQY